MSALFHLAAQSGHLDLTSDNISLFDTNRYGSALAFDMRNSFGEPMVSYNTYAYPAPPAAPTLPAFTIDSIAYPGVPAYATQNTAVPFGFEDMIAGPPSGRQVLIRLTVAAVTIPGNVRVGEAFQQVVQVYDY